VKGRHKRPFFITKTANPMSNRRATVTQADIARAIRAAKKEGLTVARLVVRIDGVAVETSENDQPGATMTIASESEVVL
jgi:hypothetical protein